MTAALVGFLGVVVGLAVGFGYRFWATRRSELAEAVIATAILRDELRELLARRSTSSVDLADLQEVWKDQRRWLIMHMAPADFETLAKSISADPSGSIGKLDLSELASRIESLNDLFWREYQAFILTPFVHYLYRDTVSKRIRHVLEPPSVSTHP